MRGHMLVAERVDTRGRTRGGGEEGQMLVADGMHVITMRGRRGGQIVWVERVHARRMRGGAEEVNIKYLW